MLGAASCGLRGKERTRGAGRAASGAGLLRASSESKARSALARADAVTHCFRIHSDSTLSLSYNPSGLVGWGGVLIAKKIKMSFIPNVHLGATPSLFRDNCLFIMTPSGTCHSMDVHTQVP